jgi:hypothetical protein
MASQGTAAFEGSLQSRPLSEGLRGGRLTAEGKAAKRPPRRDDILDCGPTPFFAHGLGHASSGREALQANRFIPIPHSRDCALVRALASRAPAGLADPFRASPGSAAELSREPGGGKRSAVLAALAWQRTCNHGHPSPW